MLNCRPLRREPYSKLLKCSHHHHLGSDGVRAVHGARHTLSLNACRRMCSVRTRCSSAPRYSLARADIGAALDLLALATFAVDAAAVFAATAAPDLHALCLFATVADKLRSFGPVGCLELRSTFSLLLLGSRGDPGDLKAGGMPGRALAAEAGASLAGPPPALGALCAVLNEFRTNKMDSGVTSGESGLSLASLAASDECTNWFRVCNSVLLAAATRAARKPPAVLHDGAAKTTRCET